MIDAWMPGWDWIIGMDGIACESIDGRVCGWVFGLGLKLGLGFFETRSIFILSMAEYIPLDIAF